MNSQHDNLVAVCQCYVFVLFFWRCYFQRYANFRNSIDMRTWTWTGTRKPVNCFWKITFFRLTDFDIKNLSCSYSYEYMLIGTIYLLSLDLARQSLEDSGTVHMKGQRGQDRKHNTASVYAGICTILPRYRLGYVPYCLGICRDMYHTAPECEEYMFCTA
jgi:hypothetical protein